MTLSAITPGQVGKSNEALSRLSQDYDRFITLLVAQVKYQDPLKPMDSTQFVSQIAQLTQVEQAVKTNDQIEDLRSAFSVLGAMLETSLVGKSVTVASDAVQYAGTPTQISYDLSGAVTGLSIAIKDSSGRVVRTISGVPTKGDTLHDVTWDGLDDTGAPVPAGSYKVELISEGGGDGYNTYTSAVVKSVEYTGGDKFLRLENGALVSAGDIVRAG